MERALADPEGGVRAAAICWRVIDPERLDQLAVTADGVVRRMVALHEQTADATLVRLAADRSLVVCADVLNRGRVPERALELLADRCDATLDGLLASRVDLPDRIRAEVLRRSAPETISPGAAADRPSTAL